MKVLVNAPHPDDETLGVGGTLLRRKDEGAQLAWLIVTGISEDEAWDRTQVQRRENELEKVSNMYGFEQVYNLRLKATQFDKYPISDLVGRFSDVFIAFIPNEIVLPHRYDVHTDHKVVFDVAVSCSKWIRYPSVKRVLTYETLSETDFSLVPNGEFKPNYFINIEKCLNRKLNIMSVYKSELRESPFPRSLENIRASATIRGSASGYMAAEAFQLLRERC